MDPASNVWSARFSLIIIATLWLFLWRMGWRWCGSLGVRDRWDRLTIGTVLPCAGLILSIHFTALPSLWWSAGTVRPATIALTLGFLTLVACYTIGRVDTLARSGCVLDTPGKGPTIQGSMRLSLFLVAGLYLFFAMEALTRYPTGYDGLYYHLPMAARWAHSGRLDLIAGDLYHSLPGNGLMVPMLVIAARLERWLTMVNVPNGMLLVLVLHGLARNLGARRPVAVAVTCIGATVPIVLYQSFSSYIDLYGMASWATALLALMWSLRVTPENRAALLWIGGLSAGVALGSKSTYLAMVPILVVTTGILIAGIRVGRGRPVNLAKSETSGPFSGSGSLPKRPFACPPHDSKTRAPSWPLMSGVSAGLIVSLGVLVCSSFWFIRGQVQAGNPVYPFAVNIGRMNLLPGFDASDHVPARSWTRKLAQWSPYPWVETNYAGTGYPYGVNNALGCAFATFVPVGAALTFGRRIRRGARTGVGRREVLLLFLAAAGWIMLPTVFTEVIRYGLPMVILSIPVAAKGIDVLFRRHPRSGPSLLLASLTITGILSGLKPAASLAGRFRDHQWGRDWFYQLPAAVDGLTPPDDRSDRVRILNLGPPDLTFPLMGDGLRHEVIPETLFHLWKIDEESPSEAMRRMGINYVVVRGGRALEWAATLPFPTVWDDSTHRPLSTTPTTRILRVPPAGASQTGLTRADHR